MRRLVKINNFNLHAIMDMNEMINVLNEALRDFRDVNQS